MSNRVRALATWVLFIGIAVPSVVVCGYADSPEESQSQPASQSPQATPVPQAPPSQTAKPSQAAPTGPAVNADGKALAEFEGRVKEYLELRKKLVGSLNKLPENATPEEIDKRQRTLGAAVMGARKQAKIGDVFGVEYSDFVRRQFAPIFNGKDGKAIRAAIFEEPHPAVPAVNARYPDAVPLSTMPPEVLKVLPALETGMEFRFIGRHLILLDVDAHVIVDLITNAMPA